MTKKQTHKRLFSLLHSALRGLCLFALVFSLAACNEDPEFTEGEGTNTDNGNGNPDGGSTDVGGTGTASARLSWDIPAVRENGENLTLSEIAGYEIVYRLISEQTYSVITIEDNNSSSHTINNLRAGNYEFMIAVFDTEGLYSDYSDPVVATLSAN